MHACRGCLGHEQLDCVDGGSSHYNHRNECRNNASRLEGEGDGEEGTAPGRCHCQSSPGRVANASTDMPSLRSEH